MCLVVPNAPGSQGPSASELFAAVSEAALGHSCDLACEPPVVATEGRLSAQLQAVKPEFVQLVGECRGRAANHTTFTLLSEAGGTRLVSARHLGSAFASLTSLKLVVVNTTNRDAVAVRSLSQALSSQGVPLVLNGAFYSGPRFSVLARTLYCALAEGRSVASAFSSTKDALARLSTSPAIEPEIELLGACAQLKLKPPVIGIRPDLVQTRAVTDEVDSKRLEAEAELTHERLLNEKRERGEYDVFLCYHGASRTAVRQVGLALKRTGLLPWFDEWELTPGVPWQPALEQCISNIKAVAVFVGAGGIGPWQQQEIGGFLRQFAERRVPVIPVLLHDVPTASHAPHLPGFLGNFTWVDFRVHEPDPMMRLRWGITGVRPAGY